MFGPAVFTGAMLGGLCWWLVELVGLPGVAGPGTFAAIGMAASASALLGAPISTVLIVFELTRDYGITLGVMTAAAVASTVMQFGAHGSFFRWQLARRGVNISAGRDISLLVGQSCESLISTRYLTVSDTLTCGELESRMGGERQRLAMFVDEGGAFRGSVNLSGLVVHAIEHGLAAPAVGAALDASFSINASTNIVSALQTMAERDLEYVPVLERLPGPSNAPARAAPDAQTTSDGETSSDGKAASTREVAPGGEAAREGSVIEESGVEMDGPRVAFAAPVQGLDQGEPAPATVSMDDPEPSVRGRAVPGAVWEASRARSMGFILADGRDAPFRLVVRRIEVCR